MSQPRNPPADTRDETLDAASDAGSIRSNAATYASSLASISTLDLNEMSASPAPSDGSQAQAAPQEQITFRFCRDCSNMLYPKESLANDKLVFACRTCDFEEEATAHCIYRNHLYNTAGETAGVTQDVGADPTLPRSNKQCPKCHEMEAVFFQSQQRSAETGMKLFYVCCSCGTIFQ